MNSPSARTKSELDLMSEKSFTSGSVRKKYQKEVHMNRIQDFSHLNINLDNDWEKFDGVNHRRP